MESSKSAVSVIDHIKNIAFDGVSVFQKQDQIVVITDARKDPAITKSSKREFLLKLPVNTKPAEAEELVQVLRHVYENYRSGTIPYETYFAEFGALLKIRVTPPSEAKPLVGHLINLGTMGRKVYEVSVN